LAAAKDPGPAPRRADAVTRPLHPLAAGLVAISLVAGCAASGSVPRPTDFSRHTATPQVDLHWNVTRDGDEIQVDGLAVSNQPELVEATLQLIGLDGAGEIVGTAFASVRFPGQVCFGRRPVTRSSVDFYLTASSQGPLEATLEAYC